MAWHGSVSPRGTGIDHKRPHESVDYISHNVSSKRRDDSSGLGGAGGAWGAAGAAGEAGAAGAAGLWAGNRGLGAGLVTVAVWRTSLAEKVTLPTPSTPPTRRPSG